MSTDVRKPGLYGSYERPRPVEFDGEALRCAACGGNCLHHMRVETFNRKGEDNPIGQHVTVHGYGEVAIDNLTQNNPSARRDGLSIFFWCEFCTAVSILSIAQHKGFTHLDMRASPDEAHLFEQEPEDVDQQ